MPPETTAPHLRPRELTGGRSFPSWALPRNPEGRVSLSSRNEPFAPTSPAPLWLFKHFLPRVTDGGLGYWGRPGAPHLEAVAPAAGGLTVHPTLLVRLWTGQRRQTESTGDPLQKSKTSVFSTSSFLHRHPRVPRCRETGDPASPSTVPLGSGHWLVTRPSSRSHFRGGACAVAFPEAGSALRPQNSQDVLLQGAC